MTTPTSATTELPLQDYLGGKAYVNVAHESDRRFTVMLAAALHVANDVERAKLRKVFPKLVEVFDARHASVTAGLLPGEAIPGIGVMGENGRIMLPCGCDRDVVRETETHGDDCTLVDAETETQEANDD